MSIIISNNETVNNIEIAGTLQLISCTPSLLAKLTHGNGTDITGTFSD